MGFLRRLLRGDQGGSEREGSAPDAESPSAESPGAESPEAIDIDADERARELELARFDQERLDDLVRRQQRFADRKWTPPAQGGERRADDEDARTG